MKLYLVVWCFLIVVNGVTGKPISGHWNATSLLHELAQDEAKMGNQNDGENEVREEMRESPTFWATITEIYLTAKPTLMWGILVTIGIANLATSTNMRKRWIKVENELIKMSDLDCSDATSSHKGAAVMLTNQTTPVPYHIDSGNNRTIWPV